METLTESYLLLDGTIKLTDGESDLVEPEVEANNEKPNLPNTSSVPDTPESLLVKVDRGHSTILEPVPEKLEESVNSNDAKGADNSSIPKSVSVERQASGGGDTGEVDSMFAGKISGFLISRSVRQRILKQRMLILNICLYILLILNKQQKQCDLHFNMGDSKTRIADIIKAIN